MTLLDLMNVLYPIFVAIVENDASLVTALIELGEEIAQKKRRRRDQAQPAFSLRLLQSLFLNLGRCCRFKRSGLAQIEFYVQS